MAVPWTDAESAQLRELHQRGLSAKASADAMGRPLSTVQQRAARLGLKWAGTPQTENAIAAHKERARKLRGELEADTLAKAQRLSDQLFAKTKIYNFGGKDNTYNERDAAEPPFADKAKLAQAVTSLINASIKLAEYDADYAVDGAKSVLSKLAEQLGLGSAPADE